MVRERKEEKLSLPLVNNFGVCNECVMKQIPVKLVQIRCLFNTFRENFFQSLMICIRILRLTRRLKRRNLCSRENLFEERNGRRKLYRFLSTSLKKEKCERKESERSFSCLRCFPVYDDYILERSSVESDAVIQLFKRTIKTRFVLNTAV